MGREKKQVNSSTDNLRTRSKGSRCCVRGKTVTSQIGKVGVKKKLGRTTRCVCASPPNSFVDLVVGTVKSSTIVC